MLWDNILNMYTSQEELGEKVEDEDIKEIFHLPTDYLKLWRMPDFLQKNNHKLRSLEKEAIMKSWQHWNNGIASTAAVVGYLGEGVSIFLRELQKQLGGKVFYLKLNEKVTREKNFLEL
ncbi:MAG: hypothetical protein SCK28_06755, partial [Bacillota bacterium]|nr:hypothetical protein [Bacillota bacterium]